MASDNGPFLSIQLWNGQASFDLVFETSVVARTWIALEREFWSKLSTMIQQEAPRIGVSRDAFLQNVEFFQKYASAIDQIADSEALINAIEDLVTRGNKGEIHVSWRQPFMAIRTLGERRGFQAAAFATMLAMADSKEASWGRFTQALAEIPMLIVIEIFQAAVPVDFPNLLDGHSLESEMAALDKQRTLLSEEVKRLAENQVRLKAFQNALEQQIVTAEPGEFWLDKATAQAHAIQDALRWFVFIAASGLVLLFIALNAAGISLHDALKEVHIAVMYFALPVAILFWLLKHVSRLFAQSLARQQDADERLTILRTYIALLTNPQTAPKDDERRLIFETLCRPGPGSQSEAAPYEGLAESLTKALKRPS